MRSNNIAEASRTSWRVFINISSDNPDFYRRMARALLAVGEQERGCCWEGDPLLCTINRKGKASYKQRWKIYRYGKIRRGAGFDRRHRKRNASPRKSLKNLDKLG